ncbi:MAG: hypothetical protein PHF11_07875 [Candidatus Omnitrophica bacterium]|nr:hypothetical protein [Candidatus Omnitrophota bacterium]
MKKTFVALFVAVLFVGSSCFVQKATAEESSEQGLIRVQVVAGKIDSVSIGDSSTGIASRITVIEENGAKKTLRVKSDAVIKGKNGEIITIDKLKEGDKVTIECKTRRKGTNMAVAITVTK